MLYSILIYAAEDRVAALTQAQDDEHIERHLSIQKQLKAPGKLGPAVRLERTATAKDLRTGGVDTVVDGPFAETKEQLLGLCRQPTHSIVRRPGGGRDPSRLIR